jgi:hypothetical protein
VAVETHPERPAYPRVGLFFELAFMPAADQRLRQRSEQ